MESCIWFTVWLETVPASDAVVVLAQEMDLDHNGHIDFNELRLALAKLGLPVTPE